MMNHSTTKTLVEFLHSYLNLLTRFNEEIDITQNKSGFEFVCETLGNPLTHKDILTQSSIIFWMLVRVAIRDKQTNHFELLIKCLSTDKPGVVLQETACVDEIVLETGILQMAKIRGFVLVMDKDLDISKAMLEERACFNLNS